MTDTDAVIENFFIEHGGMTKEEIAAYNREYYLRTRKLKNRVKKGDVPQPRTKSTPRMSDRGDNMHRVPVPSKKTVDQIRAEKRRKFQKQNDVTPKRIEQNEEKIRRARQAARKLPQDKRNAVEKKLDAAEKKLKGLKNKLGNPFNNGKTIDRSGPVKRVPPPGGAIKGPSKAEQARVKKIQDRAVAARKAAEKKKGPSLKSTLKKLDKISTRAAKAVVKRADAQGGEYNKAIFKPKTTLGMRTFNKGGPHEWSTPALLTERRFMLDTADFDRNKMEKARKKKEREELARMKKRASR